MRLRTYGLDHRVIGLSRHSRSGRYEQEQQLLQQTLLLQSQHLRHQHRPFIAEPSFERSDRQIS